MASMLGYTTMTSSFASSIFSPSITAIAATYNVSTVVATLGLTCFVLGFAFGPTFWAPLSELRGRRLPLVLAMFGFTIFSVGTAAAKDLQTVILCRFFGGLFGAGPLAVVAAVFSDMFDNRTRGIAITIFSMTVFTGPMFAPFVGGYIMENPALGWRWTQWVPSMMGAVAFILDLLFLEETYPPAILVQKATELRRRTLNWGIHAKQEEIEVDFRALVSHNFSRPMRILFGEPIVLLLTIYTAFIYGLLYLFITAYPTVYQQVHGFSPGQSGLPFIGLIVGQFCAGVFVLAQQPAYMRKLEANGGVAVPEWRLPTVAVGGAAFAIGIFWFGWTGFTADVHWIVPTLSGILTGFGLLCIFLQSINYLVDAYLMLYVLPFRSPHRSPNSTQRQKTNNAQRRLHPRGKHLPPLPRGRRLPPLRAANVQGPRHPVGRHAARLRRRRAGAHPRAVLVLRRAAAGEERVCAGEGPAGFCGVGEEGGGGECRLSFAVFRWVWGLEVSGFRSCF